MKRFFFLFLLLLLVRLPAHATILVNQKSSTGFKVLTLDSKRVSVTPTTETQDLTIKNSQKTWYWVKVIKLIKDPKDTTLPAGFLLRPNGNIRVGRVKWHHGESAAFVADSSINSNEVKFNLAMDAVWRLVFDTSLPPEMSGRLVEISKKVTLRTASAEELRLLADCKKLVEDLNQRNASNASKSLVGIVRNTLVIKIIAKQYGVTNPQLVTKYQVFSASAGNAAVAAKARQVVAFEMATLTAPRVDALTLNAVFSGPKPQITVSNSNVTEGNSGQVIQGFRVSLSSPWWQPIRVGIATLDGTAKKGLDYQGLAGALTFAPDASLLQIVRVPVLGDTLAEGDETYLLRVGASGFTSVNSPGIGTIRDDDVFTGKFSINDVSITEGNSGQKIARFNVTLSEPSVRDISVTYAIKDGTAKASADYLATSGVLLFKPGQLTRSVSVLVEGDTVIESDKNFFVKISAAGYKFEKSTGVGTIINDDREVVVPASGKIAFSSLRDGNGNEEIYVMNADGSNQTRLTNRAGYDSDPCLSPDGSKIVFDFTTNAVNPQLWSMNSDGSALTALTVDGPQGANYAAAFSPDGSQIAFVSTRDFNSGGEIYVMGADGSNPTRLTTSEGPDHSPAWSPDGSQIAFTSQRDGNNEIYLMNADGSNPTRMTVGRVSNESPCFSPDGKKIVFNSFPERYAQIWVMNADGSGQTPLSPSDFTDDYPVFSPNGHQIAFVSAREGDTNFQIYRMNADGTAAVRLTLGARNSYPSWSIGSVPALSVPGAAPAKTATSAGSS